MNFRSVWYRLCRAWRILIRDPELRPGRKALRRAVFLTTPLGKLCAALESGSYNTDPTWLWPGCELKVEDLSAIMQVVMFDDTRIRLRPTKKVDHAALRERRVRSKLP